MVSFGDSDADSDWQIRLVCDVPTLEARKQTKITNEAVKAGNSIKNPREKLLP